MAQVSVGSLEVVSEDCFQKRLEGMSSCQDCNARQIRPTTKSRRGQKSKKQKENRHEKSESNKKHRRRLYHSNAHDDFLGPRPEGIFDPGNHANPYRKNYSAMISNIERSQLCEAMNLNNAVLSVLEKAHQKSQLFEAMNLNNAVTYADDNVRLHVCQYPMNNTVPPIVNDLKKNNLNRICNNLLSKADSFESTEGETGSQVSSTEESDTSDMSKEELSSLVSYATGYSLTRYGCETNKCPECNATSTRVLRRGKLKPPTSRESSFSGNESDEDTGEKDVKPKIKDKPKRRFKKEKSSPNSKQSKTASVSAQRQKVRKAVSISVAELGEAEPSQPAASHIGSSQIFTVTSSRPENRLPSIPTDSVYVDLTETNVDCFVYSYSAKQRDLNHHWCYPGPNSPNFWYYPHFPYYVHPAILNIPNFVSVPRPLCVPRNRDILKSQKTCMIPAQEIEHCK